MVILQVNRFWTGMILFVTKGMFEIVLDGGKVIIIQSSISTFIPNNVANITIFVKMKEDILHIINAMGGKHFQTMNVEEMES